MNSYWCANCEAVREINQHGRCVNCNSLAVDDAVKNFSQVGASEGSAGNSDTFLTGPRPYGSALPDCFVAVDEVMRKYGLCQCLIKLGWISASGQSLTWKYWWNYWHGLRSKEKARREPV